MLLFSTKFVYLVNHGGKTLFCLINSSVCFFQDADSGGDSQEESELDDQEEPPFVPPPGYMMYTVLPDGSPVPQGMALYAPPPPLPNNSRPLTPGTVVYGPPPAGAPMVYGPPPRNFSIPFIPMGVLHCNVPEHHNLVSGKTYNSLSTLLPWVTDKGIYLMS